MWNSRHSIKLSEVIVCIFIIIITFFLILTPKFLDWLQLIEPNKLAIRGYLQLTIYSGGILMLPLLYLLYALLKNIRIGNVFIRKNTFYLRVISWLCFLGGAIALFSSFYWIIWLPIGIAALFLGLIVRVIKNIMDEAISIKEENDYTI